MWYYKVKRISLIFACGLLLTGCLNTEGTLEIKGKVIDEYTKMPIPGRDIIIQGLVENDKDLVPIDIGQFSTDSSGRFTYKFKEVKNAYAYNFCHVGDSDYAFRITKIGLLELEKNPKFLSIPLSKLADLTIKIYRKSKMPLCDTLSLIWQSNGVYFKKLYPFTIENYGNSYNLSKPIPGLELVWIGGDVNSTINTKVFAEKRTNIYWELIRNNEKYEFTDTLTCKRDSKNIVYFTY
jgi:hypothetical protein